MNFIKKHPFALVATIGGIMAIAGFLLSFDDPAKALMFTGILVIAMAGFVYVGENFNG